MKKIWNAFKYVGGTIGAIFVLYVLGLFVVMPAFRYVTAKAFQSEMPHTSQMLPDQKNSVDIDIANNMDGADAKLKAVVFERKIAIGNDGAADLQKLSNAKKDDELISEFKKKIEKLDKFTDALGSNQNKSAGYNNETRKAQHIRNGNTETIILPPNFTEKTEIIFHATGSNKTCDQMYVTSQVGTVTAHYISGGEFPLGQGGEYYIMGKSNPLFLTSGPDGATITLQRVPAGK